ncbi:putative FAD-linked oxidoreductase Rv2280 [Microbacterium sp. Bi98]|uniref:FAD-binding oxidoreductase n=1 Tax=Microbacterium sp. Bi98 TaxID=2821116 RepID=UPI001D7BF1E9|nr:FAD-binding oxidoreductase [Microbacterium sp. Bi98]CAH0251374.1 putative FAD-linked oxidoreductase Rv2280 [Microbacterium sp. Bi98]
MGSENGRVAVTAEMRWNGWGDPARASDLPRAVRMMLPLLLGRVHRPATPVELAEVALAPSSLQEDDLEGLAAVVGAEHIDISSETRIRHAGGRSTPDLLRRRRPQQTSPDAVVLPGTHDEVAAVLRACVDRRIAVIPFGGGTSVVGALDPERGTHRAVVSLDLRRLSGLIHFDEASGEAILAAGTTGPDAEALLAARGFELGHYPQSFRYATIGGFAAARSSGQNSAGHGRFDSMVTGLRVATPTGDIELGRSPGSSAGPDLVRVFLGSEGIFGVITEVRVRVHPVPRDRLFEAWTFADFTQGVEGLRRVTQHGGGPTVLRLSDEAETAVSLAQVGRIGRALAKGASLVSVYEGDDIAERRGRTSAILAAAGGISSGEGAAEGWLSGRFDGPYLRDSLLDAGVFCETLETATTWSNLLHLRAAVTSALRAGFEDAGARSYVMCHVSHVYPTGASLYFTVIANLRSEPLDTWTQIKRRVNDALLAAGGTISHHHAVGRDHAAWLEQEIGDTGVRILAAIKRELDPTWILNPGAVISSDRARGRG